MLLLVVGLLASTLALGAGSTAVAATEKGIVNGGITCPKVSKCPSLSMLWFDANWNYINQRKLGAGARGYSLTLPVGTYHLQFVDQRPSYDVSKYAPTDVKVTVRANDLTVRNLTMTKGAAITGTVKGGGKPLGSATLRAANQGGQSFSTTANSKGQFAIGGLPAGKYSVFTWDKRKVWVGKSAWAGSVSASRFKNVKINLSKRAGQMTVYLFTPNGLLNIKNTLTVTSKETGQWWSSTSGSGTFSFKGLYPGRYNVQFNGAGVWFATTGAVQKAVVKSNGFTSGSFHLTKRGGWINGTVVDGGDGDEITDFPMQGVVVGLYNEYGTKIASATTNEDGNFQLKGQLATQSGLMVSIDPNPNSGGWMRAAPPDNWCLFLGNEVGEFGITQGQGTEIGAIGLPRSTDSAQANQCLVPTANAKRR